MKRAGIVLCLGALEADNLTTASSLHVLTHACEHVPVRTFMNGHTHLHKHAHKTYANNSSSLVYLQFHHLLKMKANLHTNEMDIPVYFYIVC